MRNAREIGEEVADKSIVQGLNPAVRDAVADHVAREIEKARAEGAAAFSILCLEEEWLPKPASTASMLTRIGVSLEAFELACRKEMDR